jgi:hypothetical protein
MPKRDAYWNIWLPSCPDTGTVSWNPDPSLGMPHDAEEDDEDDDDEDDADDDDDDVGDTT